MTVDIIIPVWNQLEFTRECIESILRNTFYPFTLIIVDNGSDLETQEYLKALKQNKDLKLILIRNEKNSGFIKATNQGIKESRAPYTCLLNNDTQVASGWLGEMVKVAQSKEDIGIVNPNSNTLGYKAKKGQSPEATAVELRFYSGEYSQLPWASGFCMLIKRKVIQEVGLLNEIYGMGTFEDADFSKRAQQFGYSCVRARAAYVYHRERRSFVKFKEFDQDFQRNRKIFFSKWGKIERILYVLTKDNPTTANKVNKDTAKLASKGNTVWVFLKDNKNRLNKHFNVSIYNLPKSFFNLISIWRILKRKKKFDRIYVDDKSYAKKLNKFKLIHKAEVIYER